MPKFWRILFLAALLTTHASARANHLKGSSSPYLAQHSADPVDWCPWSEEALAKARKEDKPIFLSIGYSSCYWCHVAERELYSDPAIATLMNQWFINIKVDREERPDLDALYMDARLLITGGGGWPNNVFLTPDLKPFFAGSYFPATTLKDGTEGFPHVLSSLNEGWHARRSEFIAQGDEVLAAMRTRSAAGASRVNALKARRLALTRILKDIDLQNGGMVGINKYPKAPTLGLLLDDYARSHDRKELAAVTAWLDAMSLGGIRDQLDGGFHRYCVEPTWSIPHFEKMLPDNAQLLSIYARAFAVTHRELYRQSASGIASYLRHHLAAAAGGFYSSEDAEVSGREGANYLWKQVDIERLLGDESGRFFDLYELTPLPEAEVPNTPPAEGGVLRMRANQQDAAMRWQREASARATLLAARDKRPAPRRDEKIIVAFNGLAIRALAEASRELNDQALLDSATRSAQQLWDAAFSQEQGLLHHEIFAGVAQGEGFAQDYALLGLSFLSLAEIGHEPKWRARAEALKAALLKRFRQGEEFWIAPDSGLVMKPVDYGDDSLPSGSAATVELLERLAEERDAAGFVLQSLGERVAAHPERWPSLLAALPNPKESSELNSARHVAVDTQVDQAAGSRTLRVRLKIDSGYHLNANPASFDYLIPTQLLIEAHPEARIRYPQGHTIKPAFAPQGLSVYEGTVTLSTTIAGTSDESAGILASLTVQACTNEACLPPDTLHVHFGLKAGAP